MYVMRIVLATVCCRFGSGGFVTSSTRFGQDFEVEGQRDFEAEAWSVFCEIILLYLGQDSEAGFGHDFKSRY